MLFSVACLVAEISAYETNPNPGLESPFQNDRSQTNLIQFLAGTPHCLTSEEGLLDDKGVRLELCRDSSDKLCPVAKATGGECKGTYCELWHSDERPSNLTECAQYCFSNEDKKACFVACLQEKTWEDKSLTDVFVQMLFAMDTCDGGPKLKIPQVNLGNFTTQEDYDCKETLIDLSARIIAIAAEKKSFDEKCIRPSDALFSANYLKCRSELPGSPESMSQEDTDFVFGSEFSPHNRESTDYVKTFVFDTYKKFMKDFRWLDSRGNICVPIKELLEEATELYLGEPLNASGQIMSMILPGSPALQV
jgi:hypothetical protein